MRNIVIASLASAALVLGSTAAAAAPPQAAQAQAPSGWTMLTALSGTPGAAVGGAAAAAQPADADSDDDRDVLGFNGEVVAILVMFGLIIAALLIDDEHGEPVSPD